MAERSSMLTVLMTPAELDALRRMARESGVSMASLVRKWIGIFASERGIATVQPKNGGAR